MRNRSMLLTISVFLLTVVWPGLCQAQSVPQRIEITAKRFNFVPGDITLKKGQAVVLILKSSDVEHGLRIREFGVNAIVKPGQTVEIKFTPDKVGDFVGHCSAFCGAGHGSMEIKLHVVA